MIEETYFASAAVALVVTIVFMISLPPVAKAIGLVDKPGGRKSHVGEVPVIGGIGIFTGMFAGLMLLPTPIYHIPFLFVASLILLLVGMVDDRFHIPAPARLAAQIAATLVMVFGANLSLSQIGNPFGIGEIELGGFTLVFTTLVTLTVINAYNLIDGADGLAGSLALIALAAVSIVTGVQHPAVGVTLTIAAAVIGFLVFNFPTIWNRALRAFMGDAGSTLLGFTIVWVTLGISQGPDRLISPVLCLWFASIPIYDTFTCFVRRSMTGNSPFTPGRDHFHHKLLGGGFGVRQTLGILTGFQILYALIALGAHFAGVADGVMFIAWSLFGLLQGLLIKSLVTLRGANFLRKQSS